MEDLLEAFELQQFRHGHAAELADRAEVVALEVGDHDQLGDFLRRGEQIVGGFLVGVRHRRGAGACL